MEITVLGRHEYVVAPETGLLTVVVTAEAPDRAAATAEVSALASELASALDHLADGGPVSWRSVGAMTTSSWRPYGNDGEPRPPRHAASVRVQARFTDVPALAAFVGDWGVRDRCEVQGVEWELSDATRARLDEDALARAVEDASRRASVIARASGAALVEAVAFRDPSTEQDGPVPIAREMMMARGRAADAGPSPIVAADISGVVMIEGRFRASTASVGTTPAPDATPRPRRVHR